MNIQNINIGNNLKENDNDLINEIDKHVEIKYLKEGRRNKTYVYGLSDFIDEKVETDTIGKLKKKLGTNISKL